MFHTHASQFVISNVTWTLPIVYPDKKKTYLPETNNLCLIKTCDLVLIRPQLLEWINTSGLRRCKSETHLLQRYQVTFWNLLISLLEMDRRPIKATSF